MEKEKKKKKEIPTLGTPPPDDPHARAGWGGCFFGWFGT